MTPERALEILKENKSGKVIWMNIPTMKKCMHALGFRRCMIAKHKLSWEKKIENGRIHILKRSTKTSSYKFHIDNH